jgi:hypothetical protein
VAQHLAKHFLDYHSCRIAQSASKLKSSSSMSSLRRDMVQFLRSELAALCAGVGLAVVVGVLAVVIVRSGLGGGEAGSMPTAVVN